VAKQLKMELVTVWVKPDECAWMRLSSAWWANRWLTRVDSRRCCQRAAQDDKMVLVGEGADELFWWLPDLHRRGVSERFARCRPCSSRHTDRSQVIAHPSWPAVEVMFETHSCVA